MDAYLTMLSNLPNIRRIGAFTQHGDTSCLLHSIAVAYYSLAIARRLGLRLREKELLRGAMLHDYFLYDWHDGDPSHRLHGFFHPRTALENARRDFQLTKVEENIIRRHMFPLTIVPPTCREAFLVMLVDKGLSLYETCTRGGYKRLRAAFPNA